MVKYQSYLGKKIKTVMCARDGSEDEGLAQPGTQVESLES